MMQRAVIFLLICAVARSAPAQHVFEARGADTKYRYVDWNYTFSHPAVIDLFYVGVPGSNEFNLGGGYAVKPARPVTITPLAYLVVGKEGSQRGVKIALLVNFELNGWKLNSFLAHFAPISGDVPSYQVLDTLDFSKSLGRHWELGISNGFFHAANAWNPQIGPLVKLNDRFGCWAFSYRFGPQREARLSRVFIIR